MKKIVITTSSFADYDSKPMDTLKDNGLEIVTNPHKRKLYEDEIVGLCKGAIGIIAGVEKMDAATLEKLPGLKVISRCGVGMENVDLDAANRLGIKVFNTPDAPTLAVAELTVGLIFNLLRKISRMDASVKIGKWDKMMGNLLFGKRVGIIGFGRIGQKVAGLLKNLVGEIVYADPYIDDGVLGFKKIPLTELLTRSDIITLHVSGKEKILGENEFQLIKDGVWLINVSRGKAVDEDILLKYLKDKRINAAALDVFSNEPYNGPLQQLENVILTPHIGSYAAEARVEMEIQAVNNLLRGLNEK